MEVLTERQKLLLTLIIHEFAKDAAPVGSKSLVDQFNLDLSTATVRNDMSALTDMGYLRQPHTSAGRVPTESGYRFFVGNLLQHTDLPDATRHMISHQFYQMRHDVDQWMRLAVSVLASQSQSASLITAPHAEKPVFKHVELISTRGRQVLMVLVLMGGDVRQRLLTLNEPMTQERLSQTAEQVTRLMAGSDITEMRILGTRLDTLGREMVDWAIEEMISSGSEQSGELYLDGLSNVFVEPEFSTEEGRGALRILEERSTLQQLFTQTLPNTVNSVQVLIGGEGNWEELRQCSLILSRYGAPGLATGTLGVLGPMRMPYGRAISTVRFLSRLLSDLVTETLVTDDRLDIANNA